MHIRETLENIGKQNQNKTTLLLSAPSDIIMVNILVCILSTFLKQVFHMR